MLIQEINNSKKFDLCEAGDWYDSVFAESAEEAIEIAKYNVDRSNYDADNTTLYIDVRAHCEETEESKSDTVVLEPEEPDCTDEDGHNWKSPYSLVGGCKSNPGVFGNGGGVLIYEVCVNCGCGRETDTWAQRRDTGEQGFTEVSYELNKYNVASYHIDKLKSNVYNAGCKDAVESAAWLLYMIKMLIKTGDWDVIPYSVKHAKRINEVMGFIENIHRFVVKDKLERAICLGLRLAAKDHDEKKAAMSVIKAL